MKHILCKNNTPIKNILVITNIDSLSKSQSNLYLLDRIKTKKFDSCFFVDGGYSNETFKFLFDNQIVNRFYFIGDKDSLGEKITNDKLFEHIINLPCEKDDTDLNYTFKEIFKVVNNDYSSNYNLFILNFFLGRMSMSFGNLQSLCNYYKYFNEIEISYYNETKIDLCYIIKDKMEFDIDKIGIDKKISFLSIHNKVKVSIENFKYEYNGFITNSFPIAISNEFVNNKTKPLIKVLSKNKFIICFIE